MTIADARPFVGRNCKVRWADRAGRKHDRVLYIDDLQYIPLYGTYLIAGAEEVSLDKVIGIRPKD